MKHFANILGLLATAASAHMRMSYPAPINALGNPNGGSGEDQREPITGSQFPCRGYHALFPNGVAAPVEKWEAGSTQKITMIGEAPTGKNFQAAHKGGSGQISFSTDGGKTFRVVKSYIGNFPALNDNGGMDLQGNTQGSPVWNGYPFTVPKDLPAGPVLVGMVWFNHAGNREMYMNCASVEITGHGGDDTVKFSERPEIFKANINNGCATTASTDVDFPAPGPDVTVASDAKRSEPEGSEAACGKVNRSAPEATMTPQDLAKAGCGIPGPPVPANADGNAFIECGGVNPPARVPDHAQTQTGAAAAGAAGDRKLKVKPKTGAAPAAPADNASANDAAPAVVPSAPATSAAPVAATSTPAAPAAPAHTPAPASNASSGTSEITGVLTGKCDTTGMWNCIDGKSFQRCASGAWSVSMAMAAGTACEPGMSSTLEMVVPAKGEVRFSRSHFHRHMGRLRS